MSPKMKVAARNIEAVLASLDTANCPNGCECIFCKVWNEGYRAGLEEAAEQVGELLSKIDPRK